MATEAGGIVALTPLAEGLVRIQRESVESGDSTLHIAGGQHTGIVIRKRPDGEVVILNEPGEVQLEFSVFIFDGTEHSQERRKIKFWFQTDCVTTEKYQIAQEFFKELCNKDEFPRDYAGYMKRVLKLIQNGYPAIAKLELEMKPVEKELVLPKPSRSTYESNIWERALKGQKPDASHVQEILEHAYPSCLTEEGIAKTFNCDQNVISELLLALEKEKIATHEPNTHLWSRTPHHLEQISQTLKAAGGPTVAIVTALYVEKLAIDAVIENRQTYVRYKTAGESNIYTLGNIGNHRVVATKLSAVGHERDSMIASGSITTRLLGGFQSIEHVLIVGVGGGVPHYADASRHVRLGDVVVSVSQDSTEPSYVYCDSVQRNRVTKELEGYKVKTWRSGDDSIRNVCREIKSESDESGSSPPWNENAEAVEKELLGSRFEFVKPPVSSDKLYMWVGGEDVVEVTHPDDRNFSKLHLGAIGSGRQVLEEPTLRSDFANQFGLRAYDQEFDSVVEAIFGNRIGSWACVRGISDYVDGTRNKEWQPYAALQAAMFVKSLLSRLPAP